MSEQVTGISQRPGSEKVESVIGPSLDQLKLFRKICQVVFVLVGATFTVYNLAAFKVDSFGLYYHDDNQIWLAFGVGFLTVSWLIKNWKQI